MSKKIICTFVCSMVAFALLQCGESGSKTILSSNKNISEETPAEIKIADAKGNITTLGDKMTKEYLFVDFSRSGCSACQAAATDINSNKDFQDTMTNFKCSMVTITPKSGLSAWLRVVGQDSWVAGHSYRPTEMEYDKVASALNFQLSYVPTFLLIDKKWNIVKRDGLNSAMGDIESHDNAVLKQICLGKK